MKIVGVIPARFASSRFPGKVLADILGKSLVQRTYENATKAKLFSKLVVAVDEESVYDHVKGFGGEAVMTSRECLTGSDRAAEAVERYFPEAEVVVVIQADEPCIDPHIFDLLAQSLLSKKDAVATTAATPLFDQEEIESRSVVKCVFDKKGRALYFSRAPIPGCKAGCQNDQHHYFRHVGVYCFRKEFLLRYGTLTPTPLQMSEDLEQLKILEHGYPLYVSLVENMQECLHVDHVEDVKKVEAYLCRMQENTYSLPVV